MQLVPLNKSHINHALIARTLYEQAFPIEEKRDKFEQDRVENNPDYHFDLIMENGELLGIALYWQTPNLLFLEHFAILPEKRNTGIGSKSLSLLKTLRQTVLLEIEPPKDELTNRRLAFYERNGFKLNPYYHIQAKLKRGDEPVELKILTYPEVIPQKQYLQFIDYMAKEISVLE